ncbi:MAG: hypothetical protein R3F61_22705 [Myxococcota bacterium]
MWFTLAALAQVQAPRLTEHPEALPEQAGCDRYEGTASGNDPTVRLVVVLCEEGSAVTGQLQWSSLVSGWNVRDLEGGRDGDVYTMRDVAIVEEKAEPGWRFCKIDRYSLRREGDAMQGDYRSLVCNDTAQIALARMGSAPAPHDGPVEATPLEPPQRSSGLCSVASTVPVGGGLVLLGALGIRTGRRTATSK